MQCIARYLIVIFIFSISSYANAGQTTLKIVGVNQAIVYQEQVESIFANVGILTNTALENALLSKIVTEYKGSVGGVSSIDGMGGQIEILSEKEMKAYGWCYKVDGIEPNVMPNNFSLSGNESVIEWFFAYAHYSNGRWISMCTPADHFPSDLDLNKKSSLIGFASIRIA